MKKLFVFLFIIFSIITYSQDKKKQRIKMPIKFKVGLFSESFYQGNSLDSTLSVEGNVMRLFKKSEGFDKPMYGFKLSALKPINNKIDLGLEFGLGRVRDIRNQVDKVYYYTIPISLLFDYHMYDSKDKVMFKPFFSVKAGYTYMNDNAYEDFGLVVSGGFSYGADIGFSINSKEMQWLSNVAFTIGYSNFFKNHEEKRTGPPYTATFNYSTRNEGLTFGLQYQIPLKHKKKRRKKY